MSTEADEGWVECSDPTTLAVMHSISKVQILNVNGNWVDLPLDPVRDRNGFDLAVNRIGWKFRIPTTTYITQEDKPMTDLNIYRPTGTVQGPVLAADIPEGWEWKEADCGAESETWAWKDGARRASLTGQLYWVRPPSIKAGDRVRPDGRSYEGTVLHVTDDGFATVRWSDQAQPVIAPVTQLVKVDQS